MSSGNDAVFRRLDRLVAEVRDIPKQAVGEVGAIVKLAHEVEVARVTGGDRMLSGMGNKARLTAQVIPRPSGGSASAVVQPYPKGQWAIVEEGAKQHLVGSRRSGSRRRLKEAFAARSLGGLRDADFGFLGNPARGFAATAPVVHPGSPARPSWVKGRRRAEPLAARAVGRLHRRALVRSVGRG